LDSDNCTESTPHWGQFRREEAPIRQPAVNCTLSMSRALPRRDAAQTTKSIVSGFAGASVGESRTLT
jgi:hypothetical protein